MVSIHDEPHPTRRLPSPSHINNTRAEVLNCIDPHAVDVENKKKQLERLYRTAFLDRDQAEQRSYRATKPWHKYDADRDIARIDAMFEIKAMIICH